MIRSATLAGLLAITGCGMCGSKDGDKPAPPPSTDHGGASAAGSATAEAPAPAPASTPADADLARLPVGSELVLGVDVARLVGSETWKRIVEPMLGGELGRALGGLKDRCGIDPIASASYVTAGVAGTGAQPNGIVVIHGLPKATVTACLDKLAADAPAKLAVSHDGAVTVIKPAGRDPAALQFTDDKTAVVAFGPSAGAAAVADAVAGGSKLPSLSAFKAIYDRVDRGDTLWFVMNGSAPVLDPIAALGPRPKALFGSVATGAGLAIDLRARMSSGDEAGKLATLLRQQAAPLLGLLGFDKLDVRDDGDDVAVTLAVSAAKLPHMIDQIDGMFGGALGGQLGGAP